MRHWWLVLLLGLLVLLGVFGWFYWSKWRSITIQVAIDVPTVVPETQVTIVPTKDPDRAPGEMQLTAPPPHPLVPGRDEFLGNLGLGPVRVTNIAVSTTELDGQVVPLAEVEVVAQFHGGKYRFSFEMVDQIQIYNNDEDEYLSVDQTGIKEGETINLSLLYLPTNKPLSLDSTRSLCEEMGGTCAWAFERGFGTKPVIGKDYVREIILNTPNHRLDPSYVVPVTLDRYGY